MPGANGQGGDEPLDTARIVARLQATPAPELRVFDEVDSTNTTVRELPVRDGQAAVCLAEFQRAGRGRLDRRWLVPHGAGLCFSIAKRIGRSGSELSGLSLAVGVALRRALSGCGVADVSLKWPNDLLLQRGKLGGVLVEVLNPSAEHTTVVIGTGINFSLSEDARDAIRAAGGKPAAVRDVAPQVDRNALAAALIDAVLDALNQFETDGLDPFRDEWLAADGMRDKPVRVHAGTETMHGIARGIDRSGALAVDVAGARRYFAGGEVSLWRLADVAD